MRSLPRAGGARFVKVDELPIQAELVEVATGRLDPSDVGDTARLQRVEAGGADQTLDGRRSGVIVGRVEEHRPPRFAVRTCGERVRGERAERLHVVRTRWYSCRDH